MNWSGYLRAQQQKILASTDANRNRATESRSLNAWVNAER